ncbi:glycerol-3-phosphate ABC transporter permease [Actibacterium mucosum KCTC 23349]|uniref:sn-glycerol-3-phosphate transport system permease protein UgpE n=1 Tax=Actibacterium mucosum KCTC 23349 TaxID=1454373 RepID=A0A037ZGI8_9RHOB|nr:ABC transporter permease subunit [Actibacterium mucosum]KAJ55253.1 glycerol-3-phosphate ABC transporter permease [Actibacterium mucosum KCTC 23349]
MAEISQTIATPAAPPRRRFRWGRVFDHAVLILGSAFMLMPVLLALTTMSFSDVQIERQGIIFGLSDQMGANFTKAMTEKSGFTEAITGTRMLMNSFILGIGFALGKIVISMMAAYAIVYFRLRFATFAFWIIFTTLLLPLEVRILPSYEVVQGMGLTNTYTGLIVPLIASATGTFFFRQFFRSVPEEMIEAARIDGAGPVKFFIDILVPLSRTMIAAIFIIMFVFGWNQYLWPTLITTEEGLFTLVRGIKQIIQVFEGATIPEYGKGLALAVIAMIPPVAIVVFFQNWFVKGLVESEK